MRKRLLSGLMALTILLSLAACGRQEDIDNTGDDGAGTPPTTQETLIQLSDEGITVDSVPASTDSAGAVYTANDIIYYEDGTDETYGEGSTGEMHTAEEAGAHTVIHITRPGTYCITGTLSAGQVFVDLGDEAEHDPEAVVTLILDNADITCTVAPAVLFYRVYECCDAETDTQGIVDTSAAGANVVLADGSTNTVTGSHVARIYEPGTTKKLHKYDGAFYSKMSLNLNGETEGTGVLNIAADNEGLNSELHLTINGGSINIRSQDDGINTNEDYISVTTVNGGSLTINAGLGSEGDGIDSNGYLTINGGTVYSYANGRTGDGGIDADSAILLNGGTVAAFGSRNDAADNTSQQAYMELSFASTLPAGSVVEVRDEAGSTILTAAAEKDFQSLTLSCAQLALDVPYSVYVDGVRQQYTGNSFGMGQIPGNMGQRPEGMGEVPGGMTPPEGMPEMTPPEGMGDMPVPEMPAEGTGEMPQPEMPTQGGRPGAGGMGGWPVEGSVVADGSVEFILTEEHKSFSGVSDSTLDSGKTRVRFTVEGLDNGAITAITCDAAVPNAEIQITVTDDPSEDYAETCLLSDGLEAVNALLPEDAGSYVLTVAAVSGSIGYTGVSQFRFTVGGE